MEERHGSIPHRGYMGGCQNYDPFLGTLIIRCRIVIGIQQGTIILTTTHIGFRFYRGYRGQGLRCRDSIPHRGYMGFRFYIG